MGTHNYEGKYHLVIVLFFFSFNEELRIVLCYKKKYDFGIYYKYNILEYWGKVRITPLKFGVIFNLATDV